MGLLRANQLRRRGQLLPRSPSARQDPSSSSASSGQSTGRDPAWLLGPPAGLSRRNRLAEVAYGCRLTFTAVGCLARLPSGHSVRIVRTIRSAIELALGALGGVRTPMRRLAVTLKWTSSRRVDHKEQDVQSPEGHGLGPPTGRPPRCLEAGWTRTSASSGSPSASASAIGSRRIERC